MTRVVLGINPKNVFGQNGRVAFRTRRFERSSILLGSVQEAAVNLIAMHDVRKSRLAVRARRLGFDLDGVALLLGVLHVYVVAAVRDTISSGHWLLTCRLVFRGCDGGGVSGIGGGGGDGQFISALAAPLTNSERREGALEEAEKR